MNLNHTESVFFVSFTMVFIIRFDACPLQTKAAQSADTPMDSINMDDGEMAATGASDALKFGWIKGVLVRIS